MICQQWLQCHQAPNHSFSQCSSSSISPCNVLGYNDLTIKDGGTRAQAVHWQRPHVNHAFASAYIDCLVQDCNNSITIAHELLQSCSMPSIYSWSIGFKINVAFNEEGDCFPHQLALGTSSVHAATRCTLLTLKHSIIAHMTKAIA